MHDVVLRDGRLARVRALAEADAPALGAFVRMLSPEARHARFFNAVSMLSAERLRQLLASPGLSVAAFDLDGRIVAHAQYVLADRKAEFAVVVAEGWRRNRLGAALLWTLKQHAMDAGARTLGGDMLADNHAMRGAATKLGFTLKRAGDPVLLRAVYAAR
jgi:GNAT superfamily N-acetyltransferase